MIAALPIAALALAATPATEAETRRIQAQLDTASQLFEKGLYADAHEVLRGVEETLGAEGEASFPLLRFMMARCLDAMGRHDEALAALARFEALARTDDERRLAADWRARIRARSFGGLRVECPAGATAQVDDGEPAACPAAFEALPAGPVEVRVRGAGAERRATVTVVAAETLTITPPAPPPWWYAGVSLGGGAVTLWGELPDFVEPTAGGRARAAVLGELRVWEMLWVRLGAGYAFEQLRYHDRDLDADGTWLRQTLDVPVAVRAELPWWSLGVEAGGGVWFLLDAEEMQGGETIGVGDAFEEIGGQVTVGVDRSFALDPITLRLALRHHHGLTPALTAVDARPVAFEVTLDVLY
ncbi:MAG: hypothetical protein R3F65_29475 [bacterium]|nr:hypothetical protein [Myxococcales bacterium]